MATSTQIIDCAIGYEMLGMHEDALGELEKLPSPTLNNSLLLSWRVSLLLELKRWKEALELATLCCQLHPGEPAGFLHRSFCLHELGHTGEALQLLQQAKPLLGESAVYHYNLACYTCVLGRLSEARVSLAQAFSMDPSFRVQAKKDNDLRVLWDELK